jgi:hypothetical protein
MAMAMTMTDEAELVMGADLSMELDDYLLHPQQQHTLRIVHAFMQNERKIEHVCEEMVPIDNGTLLQEKLIWCIKKQQQRQREECKMHFKLRAMFLYNMDTKGDDIQNFLHSSNNYNNNNNSNNCDFNFLVPISALDDVSIKPSIPMFAHLNALYILYEASNHNHVNHNNHNHSKKKVVQIHAPSKRKYKNTRRA